MYAAERHRVILERARFQGRVEVASLALEFDVTPETIRRDLATLVRQGLLQRAHGGAIPVERLVGFEPAVTERAGVLAEHKARIARRALAEIPDRGAVFLESGSTVMALAETLAGRPPAGLTVVTTSLPVALRLGTAAGPTVLMVGGRVRPATQATVDDWALTALAGTTADVAFVGTNGLSAERGLSTPDPAEAAVKRAALGVGRRTVLLADHSKFGVVSLCRYGSPADLDLVITDTAADEAMVAEMRAAGAAVVQA